MLNGLLPKFNFSGGTDERHGDGAAFICDGVSMLFDGFEGGTPTNGIKKWLANNGVTNIDIALLTHWHYDHYNGLLQIEKDDYFHIKKLLCSDPETLRHGCDGSANGKAVKEDIANAYEVIKFFKNRGTKVEFIGKGDKVQFGDVKFNIFREQPRTFTHLDGGQAYAFLNDGSLCAWSPDTYVFFGGDGPGDLKVAIRYFDGTVLFYDISHHGNSCPESDAKALKAAGCIVAWESCIEKNGPGTSGWTAYGARRVRQQGIPVLMQNEDVYIYAGGGKLKIRQGTKVYCGDIPYQGKTKPEWIRNAKGEWYREASGFWPTGWARLPKNGADHWFWFNASGYMATGWQILKWSKGTNWFYFDLKTGAMTTGWQKLAWSKGTNWFYFDTSGAMLTGWKHMEKDGKAGWYYLDEKTGAMRVGWLYHNGYWYLLGEDGCMVTGWVTYKGRQCYLEPVSGRNQGHCYVSCTEAIDGKTYSFDADGYATEISGATAEAAPTIIKNAGFHPGRNCGQRTEKVQYIVIHYTGSEGTAANNVNYFNNGNRGASAHYFVDQSGEIREYCDPATYYAWHCGGSLESSHHPLYNICTNRNSIGIEICTHNNGGTWEFTQAAVNAAIALTKYIMTKFSVPADRVCRHYDVTGKACPRVPGWGAVGGSAEWDKFKAAIATQARALTDNEKFIEEIGAMAKADMAKSGICAAVTVAQAILESGWGKSDLAVKANNIFGMKCSLSGNTWPGSTWDGKSAYNKSTGEYYSGSYTTVKADFRKYGSWAESVADHGAYLAGAKNGSALRYAGLVGCADYKKAAQIIKDGGYATSPDYVSKICNIVEQYNLTRFNTNYSGSAAPASQPAVSVPYLVKVGSGVSIYKAPGGDVVKTCPYGIYTIVEERDGYGRLKSGAGWLKLSTVTKQ